jgi:hypothetical protein
LTKLSPGTGYIVNIRGNRNSTTVSCANQLETTIPIAPEEVVLSAIGSATVGDVIVALNDLAIHRYTLLANPYPSQISYAAFQASNTNINNKMWTYSPFGNGNYSTYSAGVLANGATGYDNTSGDCIASGQSFFVQANTNGTVQFYETNKTNNTIPNAQYFGVANNSLVRIGLRNKSNSLLDEVVIRFNTQGTSMYNAAWDAESLSSASQSLSIIKQGKSLAIATLSDSIVLDTAKLNITSNVAGSFQLYFGDYDNTRAITLVDRFLGVKQDMRTNAGYSFNITNDTASKGRNRVYILFKRIEFLPIAFTSINASLIPKGVEVRWTVSGDAGFVAYQIERSLDGIAFIVVSEERATGEKNYKIEDINLPSNSDKFYYRVKAIGTDGSKTYSRIVSVKNNYLSRTSFSINPNPIKKALSVTFNHAIVVIKKLSISSVIGEEVMRIDNLKANSNRVSVNVEMLAKGFYILEVTDDKGDKLRRKFIKE